jgi:hypothetical protein
MPDHAGSSAIGNQENSIPPGEVEEAANVFVTGRAGDPVGEGIDPTAAQGDPVRKALAPGVPQAVFRVRRDQGIRRQSGRRHPAEHLLQGRVPWRLSRADGLVQEFSRRFGQCVPFRVVSPAVPASHCPSSRHSGRPSGPGRHRPDGRGLTASSSGRLCLAASEWIPCDDETRQRALPAPASSSVNQYKTSDVMCQRNHAGEDRLREWISAIMAGALFQKG